ncbi:hypothetical protein [Candidatus Odyssella acanthamoebae]|uniref:Uncharacterized protein n=1 Tax=Candidatus Odyssella acanthamoebae TaxID=91604 RepID=A0A077AV21_9PROT|nr:hypothetical protein [Candidatus Paracaedibacter acanthamoebae]AIK97012.1 hypothetical protein ID47_10145 [Candidatus Paracaedibacter acanthamoebae]
MTIIKTKFLYMLSFLILSTGTSSICIGMEAPHLDDNRNRGPEAQGIFESPEIRKKNQALLLSLFDQLPEEASVLRNQQLETYPEIASDYLRGFNPELMHIKEFKQYCIEPLKLIINIPDSINKISPEILSTNINEIEGKFTKSFIYLMNLLDDSQKKSRLTTAFSKTFFY